ncbi:MAG: hypothetical protein ABFR32_09720 [Bacteroidota bacterium]
MFLKKNWIYPLLFGIIGAFLGLLIRYAFTGATVIFSIKNILQAHSHVILLGFLFNALLIMIWINFTRAIDRISYFLFVALQVCVAMMMVAFIYQGYAFFSILFSTIHLWISYILLIRLWKRLDGSNETILLVKIGIFFHFLSSLGPYALGILMALNMKGSPWYQQAVFFYLHFQFLGIYFVWMLALLVKKVKLNLNIKQILIIVIGLIFLYAHSLDYSFNHWLIQFFGGFGSLLIFAVLLRFWSSFKNFDKTIRYIYYLMLIVALINVAGSFPYFANLAINNRFILIAWLHFLFLGLYIPFIWVFINKKIHIGLWLFYVVSVLASELFLIFPGYSSNWFSVSINDLLFFSYLGVFLSLTTVHINLISNLNNEIILDRE